MDGLRDGLSQVSAELASLGVDVDTLSRDVDDGLAALSSRIDRLEHRAMAQQVFGLVMLSHLAGHGLIDLKSVQCSLEAYSDEASETGLQDALYVLAAAVEGLRGCG